MSSVKLTRSLAVAGLAAALFAATPTLAETLVVRASGPSAGGFSPGKKLPDNGSVTLKDGDVLVVLDGRGTRTLRGPGVFGTGATATGGGGTNIASFLGTRDTSRARTGAVRGGPSSATPRSPKLWYVDVSKPSTVCIADATNVKLWRPASAEAGDLTISGKGGSAKVSYAEGQSLVDWPLASLPVTTGAVYTLSGAGLTAPVEIKLSVLEAGADGIENTASALISRNCRAQLDLLIETVALPDATPDVPG